MKMTDLERKLLDKVRLWVVLHPKETLSRCPECPLAMATEFECDESKERRVWVNKELTILLKRGARDNKFLGMQCVGWIV